MTETGGNVSSAHNVEYETDKPGAPRELSPEMQKILGVAFPEWVVARAKPSSIISWRKAGSDLRYFIDGVEQFQ